MIQTSNQIKLNPRYNFPDTSCLLGGAPDEQMVPGMRRVDPGAAVGANRIALLTRLWHRPRRVWSCGRQDVPQHRKLLDPRHPRVLWSVTTCTLPNYSLFVFNSCNKKPKIFIVIAGARRTQVLLTGGVTKTETIQETTTEQGK